MTNPGLVFYLMEQKMVSNPIICRNVGEDFYLAKDTVALTRWIVTDKLKNLVEKQKMNIEFRCVR